MKRVRPAVLALSASLALALPTAAHAAKPSPDIPSSPTTGACAFTPLADQTYSTFVGMPTDPAHTPDRGTTTMTIRTNHGDIPIVLEKDKAPCAVQSFTWLARQGYYDDTDCHRLTAYWTAPYALSVLQCGDPLGTGWGDPGYSFRDELDAARELANWPGFDDGSRKVYPRGTLAMANGGPDTNGSQFFLVYRDSRLRPDYTVFGHVSEKGMAVLDAIAAGGIDPGTEGTTEDGSPRLATTIVSVDRSGKGTAKR